MGRRKGVAGAALIALALAACSQQGDGDRARTGGSGDGAAAPSTEEPRISPTTGAWMVDTSGAGPLRIGMTVAEANAAVPGGLSQSTGLEPACDEVRPRDPSLAGVLPMFEQNRLVRVAIDSLRAVTREGLRLGDPASRVRMLYPNARTRPNKYDERLTEYIALPGAPADTLHRLLIATDASKVVYIVTGLYPAVEYVEGCL
jgi:hypothetical protein